MPKEARVWKITGDDLKEVNQLQLDLEERIENWIEKDITIVSDDLIVIGRQVPTDFPDFHGRIDILCIDRNGDIVIIELKRDKTPRDTVAQVLDYASWVRNLSNEKVSEIAREYFGDENSLEEVYKNKFGEDLPDVINESHRMLVVASDIDSSTERILSYLSDSYGVGINALSFQYLRDDDGSEFITRAFLADPRQVEYRVQSKSLSKRRQDDDITHFMISVYDKLSERLPADIIPEKHSRWAGLYGNGTRYFSIRYDTKPWSYEGLCFTIDLVTDKQADSYGKFYVYFDFNANYLKSVGLSQKTVGAITDTIKELDKQNGFTYSENTQYPYLGKWISTDDLSPVGEDSIANVLAWLIKETVPRINSIIDATSQS